jgi:tRNA 2-thiouridine synthesizing protein E
MQMAQTMSDILNPNAANRDPDFPNAPADWSRTTAETIARTDGIALSADHWEVIKALQGWFAEHPRTNVRELHDALDERFHAAGGLKYLYGLLPGGPVAQGCRLAGLEAPAGAADKSFGSVQ